MTRRKPWYETFFAGLYGQVLAGHDEPTRTLGEARLIKKVLRLRKGQRVLDCPCGMGRIAIALAGLGLKAAGAELNPRYVRRARRRARDLDLDVPFVRCDMRELPFQGEFDAVVNWFTSFGYFDPAGNLATARAAFQALRPGGQYLVEMLSKSWLLPRFTPEGVERAGEVRIERRSRWDEANSLIINTWKMSRGKRTETHRFSHVLYNAAEMRCLLREAGFTDVRLLGRPPLGKFSRHSRRMIAIATRPT